MTNIKVTNDDSILDTIKNLIGPSADYQVYDVDIITYINAAFLDLQQIGVGPVTGFSINDSTAKWRDFDTNEILLNSVKTYVYLKVKLLFDPPASSSVMASYEKTIDRLEWRINMTHELSKGGNSNVN